MDQGYQSNAFKGLFLNINDFHRKYFSNIKEIGWIFMDDVSTGSKKKASTCRTISAGYQPDI